MNLAPLDAIEAERSDEILRFVGIKFPLDGGVEGGRIFRALPSGPPGNRTIRTIAGSFCCLEAGRLSMSMD